MQPGVILIIFDSLLVQCDCAFNIILCQLQSRQFNYCTGESFIDTDCVVEMLLSFVIRIALQVELAEVELEVFVVRRQTDGAVIYFDGLVGLAGL